MPQMPVLIILAGGASSRMWPLREKSLLRFGTEPLLISQLRRYNALGFTDAIIVASPENADAIRQFTDPMRPMNVQVVVQPQPRGMGDAILQAAPVLTRPNAPIYVVQVHDVVDDALHSAILNAYVSNPSASHIAAFQTDDYFPGGYLIVDADGRITGMVEKPAPENRPSNFVTIVAHIHPSAALLMNAIRTEYSRDDDIDTAPLDPSGAPIPLPSPMSTRDDHYERAMDVLMKEFIFKVVPYLGVWKALKYPWHVLDVMNYFLSLIKGQVVAESAYISPAATLIGDVYIGDGAKVFPGAAVVGPAYVGAGTIVGNNSLVRGSMVLNKCEVGFTTEIARSYVADGCAMHACRVLDSVFAPSVNFSAGCTTANLRIDHGYVNSTVKGQRLNSGRDKFGAIIGQGAFLSVDVMTMPGVKIGERAVVGPGTHVLHDVQNGQRVYVKQQLIITEESADENGSH